ncbi:MAG: histidine kinase [Flavobacteriaceae bacterium]
MVKDFLLKIKFVPLHIVFWILVWLFYTYFFGFNSENKNYIYWFSSILIPVTIFASYTTVYYLIPKYLLVKKHSLFILYSLYVFIGAAYIISLSMFFGFVYMSELNFLDMPPLSKSMPFILMSVYVVVTIASAFKLLQHSYITLKKHKTLENKFLQTQLVLKEEELKFLKMQIHPHFLFNTLNTLYGFALKKADETPEMILKLSNLLDYILYQINKPFVSLKDEIGHIEDYIALEKMRFHNSLKIEINSQNANGNLKIAPMLLLPFVENSFKHGAIIEGNLKIDIVIKSDKSNIEFTISNTCNSDNPMTEGIGLKNIKKRLEMLYSNRYTLIIDNSADYFKVVLKLQTHEN